MLALSPVADTYPTANADPSADAAIVGLIRGILSLTGNWYDENENREHLFSIDGFEKISKDIGYEYVII